MKNLDLVIQYARDDKAISPSLAKEAIRALADDLEQVKAERDSNFKQWMIAIEVSNSYAADLRRVRNKRDELRRKLSAHRKEEIDG